ncbi:MAG: hypothetical protein ABFS43_17420 [Thermodesulfobacteriota bacterium]
MNRNVSIVPFGDKYIQDFARLNRDWLERHDLIEEADKHHLDAPYQSIIAPGGEIFFALARLKTALKLYESIGFEYAPLPASTEYASADIYMELHIDKGRPLDDKHH